MRSEALLMAGTRVLPLLCALVFVIAAGCASPQGGGTGPVPATTVPATISTPASSLPTAATTALTSPAPTTIAPVLTPTPAASGKLLFHFPWPAGERRTLTTTFHEASGLDFVDFTTPDAPILAAANGTVVWAEFSHPDSFNTYPEGQGDLLDMGNSVILQHGPSVYTLYLHLRHEETPTVQMGEVVPAGRQIGRQGDTGKSHGAHLHFGVVDLSFTPLPRVTGKPRESWGFEELGGSNTLVLNTPCESANTPA
jgi:murein DD-endopeptidase MepM/ murein hydrolase activator NlpD